MKRKKINYSKYLLLLVSIMFMGLVYAVQITDFFPTTDITTSNSSINLYFNWTCPEGQCQTNFSGDGTNYTLPTDGDPSLVLSLQMNNFSSLGEWANSTGCFIADTSRYGNNGSCVGNENISFTPNGKYGGAFNFSGNTSYINLSSSLDIGTDFSFFIWLKTNTTSGTREFFSDNFDATNKYVDFTLTTSTNKPSMTYTNIAGTVVTLEVCGDSCIISSDNRWNLITFVVSGSINNTKIYKNGILVSNKSMSDGLKRVGTTKFLNIGSSRGTGSFFNGSIDDFILFNKTLSINEINQIYKSTLTKYNIQNWSFQTNQTTTALPIVYNLCSSNSTTQVCSAINSIAKLSTVTANFSNSVENVKDTFYGIGNYRKFFSQNAEYMSDIGQYVDYSWNRERFLNTNMKITRQNVYLEELFTNLTSLYDINVLNSTKLDFIKQEVVWANENNNSILLTIVNMPDFLQNKSSSYCNSSNYYSCPPNNYTVYSEMILYFLNNITNGGNYKNVILEVLNEPYHLAGNYAPTGTYWLNNLSADNVIKGIEYVKLYNATYQAIKGNSTLSYIKVIGPSGHMEFGTNLMKTFLSNITTDMDGVSIHPYSYSATESNNQYNDVTDLLADCTFYGANCLDIYISEYNVGSVALTNSTNNFNNLSMLLGNSFSSILNSYPSKVSMISWEWSRTSNFSRISYNYYAILQPELVYDDYFPQYNALYNVTKSFAHLCPAGSTVYSSSADDSTIKTVTCKDGQKYNIIVINTDTVSKNVTLSQLPVTELRGYENSDIFSGSNMNLGIMDAPVEGAVNNILYLTSSIEGIDGFSWQIDNNFVKNTTGNGYVLFNNTNTVNEQVRISNANSLLATNGTSLCNGSTGLMTGNVNITLNPNGICYALDEFSLVSYSDYTRLRDLIGVDNAASIYSQLGYNVPNVYTEEATNACNSSLSAFLSYIALLGLVGTILFFSWIMAYLFGFVDKQAFNKVNMIGGIVTVILVGILLIISIFIMSTLCEVF